MKAAWLLLSGGVLAAQTTSVRWVVFSGLVSGLGAALAGDAPNFRFGGMSDETTGFLCGVAV